MVRMADERARFWNAMAVQLPGQAASNNFAYITCIHFE
jgi:hypothetical protein